MKKILFSTISLSALSVTLAMAADLPSIKSAPAPAPVPTWTGLYIGINGGIGGNDISDQGWDVTPLHELGAGFTSYSLGRSAATNRWSGASAGGQIGYNYQFANHIVVGGEFDFDWSNMSKPRYLSSTTTTALYGPTSYASAAYSSSYVNSGLNWIGTARARIGYEFGPLLPYATAGIAFGQTYSQSSAFRFGLDIDNGYNSNISPGWAAGAGVEYKIARDWSIKTEYLYTQIGSISFTNYNMWEGYYSSSGPSTSAIGLHQVRAGINYHPHFFNTPVMSELYNGLPAFKSVDTTIATPMWTGIYVGINGGYGGNDITQTSWNITPFQGSGVPGYEVYALGRSADTLRWGGALAGGQLGYNYAFSNHVVVGGEFDFNWTDMSSPRYVNGSLTTAINSPPGGTSVPVAAYYGSSYVNSGLNWIGTARARVGYEFGPLLPYATAGIAFGQTYSQSSALDFGIDIDNGYNSNISPGWAAGAGVEYKIARDWSIKTEYLYTQIGSISFTNYKMSPAEPSLETQNTSTSAIGLHQVKAGINYHPHFFDAPVIANY